MTDVRRYVRWLADQLTASRDSVKALSAPQLGHSSIEAGRVDEYDQAGTLVSSMGAQFDGTHVAVTLAGPVPPEPVSPTVTTGPGQAEVRWSGKFANGALSPMDFSHVAVHASREEIFEPDATTQRATIAGESGDVATVLLDSGVWSFLLVAVSKSGKWSDPSDPVTAEVVDVMAPTDLQDMLVGFDGTLAAVQLSVNGKNMIANSTVDADPATPGKADGDRWQKWSSLEVGGKLLRAWRWSGAVWIPELMDPTYLPLVDIGAGTFGNLDGARMMVNSIGVRSLMVSDLTNFAPSTKESPLDWAFDGGMVSGSTGIAAAYDKMRFSAKVTTGTAPAQRAIGPKLAVLPGDELYGEGVIYRVAGMNDPIYLRYYFYDSAKAYLSSGGTKLDGTAQDNFMANGALHQIKATVPDGAMYASIVVTIANTTGLDCGMYNVRGRIRGKGEFMVDGIIDGKVVRGVTVIGSEVKTSETAGNVTARMGPASVWDPLGGSTVAGIGFTKIGANDAYPAGMYSKDGYTLMLTQSNSGGAGGSTIMLGDNGGNGAGQQIALSSWGVTSIDARGGIRLSSTTGDVAINSGRRILLNGVPTATDSHWTASSTQANVPSGSYWGPGTPAYDAANTSDAGLVTWGAADTIKFRDPGIYAVSVGVRFTAAMGTGGSPLPFVSVEPTTSTSSSIAYAKGPIQAGDSQGTASVPNIKVTAGQQMKIVVFQNSGAAQTAYWRINVTRVG